MAPRTPGPSELRDQLANERTLLAWLRTAITFIGLGFVVAKFGLLIREVSLTSGHHPSHFLTARLGAVVGVMLVGSGIALSALALFRFLRIQRDIEEGVVRFDPDLDIAVTVMVAVGAAILAIYLIITA